jgi:MYXO-CTERM domain-containing protein
VTIISKHKQALLAAALLVSPTVALAQNEDVAEQANAVAEQAEELAAEANQLTETTAEARAEGANAATSDDREERDDDDDGSKLGLLGLLGLAGLLGLKRRDDHRVVRDHDRDLHRDTTTRS